MSIQWTLVFLCTCAAAFAAEEQAKPEIPTIPAHRRRDPQSKSDADAFSRQRLHDPDPRNVVVHAV